MEKIYSTDRECHDTKAEATNILKWLAFYEFTINFSDNWSRPKSQRHNKILSGLNKHLSLKQFAINNEKNLCWVITNY